MARISVFGIGYVGVVSAACLAQDGHHVIAVDIVPDRVALINAGQSPIVENGLAPLIEAAVASGALSATLDADAAVRDTDASYVCVGTPSNPDGSVGLDHVPKSAGSSGAQLQQRAHFIRSLSDPPSCLAAWNRSVFPC